MTIGSIPGLSFIQNEFAVFFLSIRQNRKLWPIFPAVTKFRILFSSSEPKAHKWANGVYRHLWVSLKLWSSFHISLIVSSQHKHEILKYDPRSASPQYLVISGEWKSIGKGLKLIWQLTVFIGIHIRWLSYSTVTSINNIVVRYATCIVSIKIHPWVVTTLFLS